MIKISKKTENLFLRSALIIELYRALMKNKIAQRWTFQLGTLEEG